MSPLRFVLLAVVANAATAHADEVTLRFRFVALKSDQGRVRCGLYDAADRYLKKSFREADGVIREGRAVCQFDAVPAGTYAVAAWHDANNNEKLDTNFFGIPNEGLAWSNNARGFAGPAKWKDASFNAATVGEQEIKVRY